MISQSANDDEDDENVLSMTIIIAAISCIMIVFLFIVIIYNRKGLVMKQNQVIAVSGSIELGDEEAKAGTNEV